MANGTLPSSILSLPLTQLGTDPVADKIPRTFSESFDIGAARFGISPSTEFLVAIARGRPTVLLSRALVRAIARVDCRQVVICWPYFDGGMMRALAGEGIAYLRDEENAYLPFLGVIVSPVPSIRRPRPLSPQAQRIFANVLMGRWDGADAGELSELSGMSRASISGYLSELEAIVPQLMVKEWRRRVIRRGGLSRRELLRAFEPYLVDPVKRRHALSLDIDPGTVDSLGGLVSGETALSYYADLASDLETISIAMDTRGVRALRARLADCWQEVPWFEAPKTIVEEWSHPLDGATRVSCASLGMRCLEPVELYMEMRNKGDDDVRLEDAIEQLREEICQS